MKPARTLTFVAALAALALPACGGGATAATKAAASPAPGKSAALAAASPSAPASTKAADPVTAKADKAQPANLADDDKADTINEAIKVLDDMPTQDDLDAAAAARINESSADAEYQRLKAEIEADIAKPAEDG